MTTTITLPATNRTIPQPLARFVVSGIKGHQTHDGYAFAATVRDGSTKGPILGTFENDGRGGETYFHTRTHTIRLDFLTACALSTGPTDQTDWNNLTWQEATPDILIDWLVAEFETAKKLNASTRKGHTAFRIIGEDDQYTWRTLNADLPTTLTWCATNLAGKTISAWNGTEWVTP